MPKRLFTALTRPALPSEARISPSEVREEPSVDTRVFEGSEIA